MAGFNDIETEELVELAVEYDQAQKRSKRELDAIKAELTARGIQVLEDRNTRYVKFYSPEGTAAIADGQSLDVLNVSKLKELLTEEIWMGKVTETTETKYKYDPKLEQMLKAVFTDDYTFEYTLEEFLNEMPEVPDAKQKKLLLRKLTGNYAKDRQVLCSVFNYPDTGDTAPDFDVELYYISKIKNGELIRAFLPEEGLDETIRQLKKCLIVETKTSITIDYNKEKE